MSIQQIKGLLGLAIKAGKAVSGTFACEKAVRSGKAELVIIDKAASDHTASEFTSLCDAKGVQYHITAQELLIEEITGKANRKVVAITDGGFAVAIKKIL